MSSMVGCIDKCMMFAKAVILETLRVVIRVKDLQRIDVFLDFMYLISFICQMKATDKKGSEIRELYFSDEFTDLYEMRVSVSSNEYRTILFAVDNDNIILSKKILLLNGFLKKSTKDYSKQIKIAKQILEDFEL